MKFNLLTTAAILILNAHQTHTEESLLKKLFTSQPMSDEMRFPHLSQLPKRSIIRQKCLNSPRDVFIKNGSHQDACEKFENHIRKRVASKGAWRHEHIKVENRSELEKEALDRVSSDFSKQIAIIMNATLPEFEAYLCKQGIDPKAAEKRRRFIYGGESRLINALLYMTTRKYEAKHTLDEAIRQKNLTEVARAEEVFAAIDSMATPDDFKVT